MRLFYRLCLTFLAAMSLLMMSTDTAFCEPDSLPGNAVTYNVNGITLKLPYYRNHALKDTTDCTRAVVMIHGTGRTADSYYKTLVAAADSANCPDSTCFLIAPQFLIDSDTVLGTDTTILFWQWNSQWKQGDLSGNTGTHPRSARISSYACIDSILYRLAIRNPYLQQIVVAGHSAGGQFVNRYAAGSSIYELLADSGIRLRHVVSNPSSYVYLDSARRMTGYEDRFAKPTTTCAYNDYKYGLDGISSGHYMDQAWNVIRERYANQWVTYLLGENDTDDTAADTTLDPDCAAMLQGDYRLQRGTIFYNYLNYFYGSRINCKQWIDTVPGVGHTAYGMFRSDCGVFSLFEDDVTACNSHLLPCVWVDFDFTGTAKGSYYRPYKTIGMAVDSVESEGTIIMKAGSSSDTLTINKEVYLRSHEGTADIGGP